MTTEELKNILDLHKKWLRNEPGGVIADLRLEDLCEANLSDADLRDADLRGADLRGASLSGADLRWANLRWANLRLADLRWADLRGADLRGADLRDADLREANLYEANLSEAKDGAVCRMDFGGWSICVRSTETSIGCQTRPNEFWLDAEPANVSYMHPDASAWWAVHGPAVCAAIRVVRGKAK